MDTLEDGREVKKMQVDIIKTVALDTKRSSVNCVQDTNDGSFKKAVDIAVKNNNNDDNNSKPLKKAIDGDKKNDIKDDANSEPSVNQKEKPAEDKDETKINDLLLQIAQLLNSKIDFKDLSGDLSEKISELQSECNKLNLNFDKVIGMLKNNSSSSEKSTVDNLKSFMNMQTLDNLDDKGETKINGLFSEISQLLKSNINLKDLNVAFGDKITELQDECKKLNLDFTKIIDTLKSNTNGSEKNLLKDLLSANNLSVSNLSNKNYDESLLNKIKNEFMSALAENVPIVKSNFSSEKPIMLTDTQSSNDSNNENASGFKTSDDSKLMELSGDKSPKMDKVTSFMSMLRFENSDAVSNVPQENIFVNRANLTNDIIKAMKYIEVNNVKDLTVKVQPNNLGDIFIKVTMENGILKASVTASNKDTYSLLNSNISDIQNKLNSSDIKIQNLSLNIYNDDTTFFKDNKQKGNGGEANQNQNQRVFAVNETNDTSLTQNNTQVENSLNILA